MMISGEIYFQRQEISCEKWQETGSIFKQQLILILVFKENVMSALPKLVLRSSAEMAQISRCSNIDVLSFGQAVDASVFLILLGLGFSLHESMQRASVIASGSVTVMGTDDRALAGHRQIWSGNPRDG